MYARAMRNLWVACMCRACETCRRSRPYGRPRRSPRGRRRQGDKRSQETRGQAQRPRRNHEKNIRRVFAMYQILFETDELPNPRPTQPKKNQVKSGVWATFSHSKRVFRGLGLVLYRKRTTRNLTQPNSLQTPYSQRTSLP